LFLAITGLIEAVSKLSIQLVVTSFGINLRAETGPQKYGADGAVILMFALSCAFVHMAMW